MDLEQRTGEWQGRPAVEASVDTIVALASARGAAGVAVVRLSGPLATGVLDKIFRPAAQARRNGAGEWPPGLLVYGTVTDLDGAAIDDCLAMIMRAPRSFTGEDVAEIQCHGSPAIINQILETAVKAGARPAVPGEFSRRAFLNGKMDLAQAEALSDLIASTSETARRLALRQLRGGLSQRLREIYSTLIDAAAEIEAHIDFPEEDIPAMARDGISRRMHDGIAGMEKLLAGHERARVRQEGIRVILAGKPNAGKSSLFNAILGRERAIVSPHPGTTRDTLEATIEMAGLAVTLVDTAGIREDAGEIEQIGIERAREEIQQADLILHLTEHVGSDTPQWPDLEGADPHRTLKIWTKRDHLIGRADGSDERDPAAYLEISATTGAGLEQLEAAVQQRFLGSEQDDADAEMSRVRHADHLRQAVSAAARAADTFALGESGDLVMVDLRDALSHIGEILGERLDEQILDRIFSTFCLGK